MPDSPIIWGAANIAAFLGLSTAAVFHLLEGGKIPARRVGRRWAADRAVLRRFFAGEDTSLDASAWPATALDARIRDQIGEAA